MVRRASPASPPQALDRYLPRDASNAPGLAPQAGHEEVRHQQPAKAWPSANSPEHYSPRCPASEGESAVGIPPDPRRTDETRRAELIAPTRTALPGRRSPHHPFAYPASPNQQHTNPNRKEA